MRAHRKFALACITSVVISLTLQPAAGAAELAVDPDPEPGDRVVNSSIVVHDDPTVQGQKEALAALTQANLDGVEWTATAPNGGTFTPGRAGVLVDFFDRWQCDNGVTDHVVNSWTMGGPFPEAVWGEVSLYCGTAATHGYNHIRAGHDVEWSETVASFGGDMGWDDFMEYVVQATILAPGSYSIEGNDKFCYTTPIIIDIDGTEWTYYWPVILSKNNMLVITAYPGWSC